MSRPDRLDRLQLQNYLIGLSPRRKGRDENQIGRIVVDAVHREFGPGLLETVYEVVLARELRECGLDVERQLPIPIEYRGFSFDEGFRADILVEGKVILELKSVEAVNHAHKKQLLTYLKSSTALRKAHRSLRS